MLPLTLPAAPGEKATLKLALWPAARVKGTANPDALNPDPVTFIAETVTFAPPELVTVSVPVCELPT